MTLEDLLLIPTISRTLLRSLPHADRLAVCSLTRAINHELYTAASTWQTLDISAGSFTSALPTLKRIGWCLRGVCIDCAQFTFEQLDQLIVLCPKLRYLGAAGLTCYDDRDASDRLLKFARGLRCALPELRRVDLLGAPLLRTLGDNELAVILVKQVLAPQGIATDLEPCPREHAFEDKSRKIGVKDGEHESIQKCSHIFTGGGVRRMRAAMYVEE
ncbi:hypothetical protein PYCC9005_005002 [Savitreella phatthalungensis]